MSVVMIIVLAVLQGLTEFLPVSSSGHLVLAERVFGIHPSLALNVGLHLGTLVAVIVYYWKDIVDLLRALPSAFTTRPDRKGRTIWALAVATGITAPMGLALEGPVESLFSGRWGFWLLGLTFGLTGAFLLATRRNTGQKDVSLGIAAVVGLAQGFAVLPGISRSGSTIVAALLMGVSPKEATRFSFLLSIPVIAGAGLLEARHMASIEPVILAVGMVVAAVVGYAALRWLISLVDRGRLWLFAPYVLVLSAASIVLAMVS